MMAAAHAAAEICRPFRAPRYCRAHHPGADAPGYASDAPSALDHVPPQESCATAFGWTAGDGICTVCRHPQTRSIATWPP
jgi:hypothetical protein